MINNIATHLALSFKPNNMDTDKLCLLQLHHSLTVGAEVMKDSASNSD